MTAPRAAPGPGHPALPYTPRPLDTSAVVVPPELADLTERLAAHVHDLWARQRLAEGWRYGARRDDAARTHPGLVPYGALSDSEKAYDRETALGTVRALLALGYRVVPPAPASAAPQSSVTATAASAAASGTAVG